jgi:hypothetical protein
VADMTIYKKKKAYLPIVNKAGALLLFTIGLNIPFEEFIDV